VSSTSPDAAEVAFDFRARLPATWLLAAGLVGAHVTTALIYADRARVPMWTALFWERSVRLRVTVGGQYGPLVDDGQWWRLVRSVGLHADPLHLTVNVLALFVLGRLLEPWVGAVRWMWWFGICGVAGSVASHLAGLTQSDGASGGAFGLLGAVAMLGWRVRDRLGDDDRLLVVRWLPIFIVGNLAISLLLPFVDAVGHGGGLLVGLVLGAIVAAPPHRPGLGVSAVEALGVGFLIGVALFGPIR
jgi:rhomboid protease GluP